MRKLSLVTWIFVVVSAALAQPPIHLKNWSRGSTRVAPVRIFPKRRTPGRSHLLIQFAKAPGEEQIAALSRRGVVALSYVPDFAFFVSARDGADFEGLGLQWVGRLQPSEKISPELKGEIASGGNISIVAEFYPDVIDGEARTITNHVGLVTHDNPDVLPHHLLVSGSASQIMELAQWDEVSYIFPASQDLVGGNFVHGCAGALTSSGPVGQAIPLVGDGWDGPGLGTASLKYAFVNLTAQAPADSVESEIGRAYAEWAKVVQVTFTPTTNSSGPDTIAVLFASGAHGDGYPFTSGVLAHTFYPAGVNPEPIAGDEHFNNDESWKIGANVDVFSVALHETGHALGLGHSDNPADVMYPYYHIVTGLGPGDIAAIRQLYAAKDSETPTTPAQPSTPATPLMLRIQPPPATTSTSTIGLSGTASGGSGAIQVTWSTGEGAAGTARGSASWTVQSIPLSIGANIITVTAIDSKQNKAIQNVTVIEQAPNSPTSPPSTPTAGAGGAPPSITILAGDDHLCHIRQHHRSYWDCKRQFRRRASDVVNLNGSFGNGQRHYELGDSPDSALRGHDNHYHLRERCRSK